MLGATIRAVHGSARKDEGGEIIMKEARASAGFVDLWDGRFVEGWAVDRSRPDLSCDLDLGADPHRRDDSMLDLGCGCGRIATHLFYCSVAGEKGYDSGEHHGIPAEDSKTDYVISTSLFTHLDVAACDGYLREIGRILKPGGLAYVTFFFRDQGSVSAEAGLRPLLHRDGAWRGPAHSSVNPVAFQDLLVFQKD